MKIEMKIDMSSQAIANRLKAVNELRKLCLSLGNSSEGRKIKKPLPDSRALYAGSEVSQESPSFRAGRMSSCPPDFEQIQLHSDRAREILALVRQDRERAQSASSQSRTTAI